MTTVVRIDSIDASARRRQDMGDITGLARSIKKHGLLHPIVIDDQKRLVAGGRRLAACIELDWDSIPVTKLADLTEKQRREIELEENLQRKDLTAYEQALTIVQLRQAAKEAAEEETMSGSGTVSKGARGPAQRPTSDKAIARRTGIARPTQERAQAHVALAQKYPTLQQPSFKQSHVMAVAEAMESLPEKDRALAMELVNGSTNDPKIVIDVVKNIAAMPSTERKQVARLWASDDKRDQSLAVTMAANKPPMPDPRLAILKEAIALVQKCITIAPRDPEVQSLELAKERLKKIQEGIRGK